ncbi:MAG: hypothetical protein IJQ54_06450 [Kiritimatiellae bacterium]|nr:hypothetical protein [Kiritimatiellia bacterium]
MPENSYFAQLDRIAAALEALGAFRNALKGQVFDFATDDGVRAATAALCRVLGAEVRNG